MGVAVLADELDMYVRADWTWREAGERWQCLDRNL